MEANNSNTLLIPMEQLDMEHQGVTLLQLQCKLEWQFQQHTGHLLFLLLAVSQMNHIFPKMQQEIPTHFFSRWGCLPGAVFVVLQPLSRSSSWIQVRNIWFYNSSNGSNWL
jgi:hypothetical protein